MPVFIQEVSMRHTLLVLYSSSMFAASVVLSGCNSSLMSSSNNSSPGSGPVPVVVAIGDQVNGVAPNRKQEVQFSEAMDPSTINVQSFKVADASGKLAQGTVSYDPDYNTASFLPNPSLQSGTTYTATITTAATSTGGMPLASPYTYTFSTRDTTDTSPLSVNSVSPAANATCVSPTTAITITFNEAPDASTANSTNIAVTGPGGAVIPVTMSVNITTTQVVLTPKSSLPSGSITVTIQDVADLAGVKMASAYTWNFSTVCSGASGATYLYVEDPSILIRGYNVAVNTASLSEVPGSPIPEASSGPGQLFVNKDYVYSTTTDVKMLGNVPFPSGTIALWVYHADASSGALTQVQRFTLPFGGGIYLEPTGHNFYLISGTQVLTLAINSDGTVSDTGSSITLPGPTGSTSVAVSPNGKLMYASIVTGTVAGCGKGPCPTNDVIWQIDRDTATGALTPNHEVSGTANLHLGNLQFNASGGYLLGSSAAKQINVESVNYSTGDLAPVPGSPFTSIAGPTGDYTRAFQIDPSGKFVYAINIGGIGLNYSPKYLSVFSLSQTTGVLTQIQTFDMTPGTDATGLVVDQSLVFVTNWFSTSASPPTTPASISTFKRDPRTGFLSAGGSPIMMSGFEGLQTAAVVHYQ
jgi:hypothetical protein